MKTTYLIYIKGNANYKKSKSAYAYTIVDVKNHEKVSGGDVSDTYDDSNVRIEHKALRSALKWIIDHSNHFILHDTFVIRTSLAYIYKLFQDGRSISLNALGDICYINNYDEESCIFMLRFDDIHVEHSLTDNDPYMQYTKKLAKKLLRYKPISKKSKDFKILIPKHVMYKINDISKHGTKLWQIIGLIDSIHSYKHFIYYSKNHHNYTLANKQIKSMYYDIFNGYKYICKNNFDKVINNIPILTKQNIKYYVNNYNYKFNGNGSSLTNGINYYCMLYKNKIIIKRKATLTDMSNSVNNVEYLVSIYLIDHRNKFLKYKHNLLRNCNIQILYNN